MQKGFSVVLILVAVGLVGAGLVMGYYISNQQKLKPAENLKSEKTTQSPSPSSLDEAATWETFTNANYSLKIPPDWKVYYMKDYPYEGYPGVMNTTGVIITSFPKFPKIMQSYKDSDHFIGFQLFIADPAVDLPRLDGYEKSNQNGLIFYKRTYEFGDESWIVTKADSTKGGVLSISVSADAKKGDEEALINKSIKSVKFLGEQNSDWKTYTTKKYSFKYPKDWTIFDYSNGDLFSQSLFDRPNVIEDNGGLGSKAGISVGPKHPIAFEISDPVGLRRETGDKVYVTKLGNLRIGGAEGVKYKQEVLIGSRTDAQPEYVINAYLGDLLLIMSTRGLDSVDLETLDLIASTFKLL
jgi:hypothetical protein